MLQNTNAVTTGSLATATKFAAQRGNETPLQCGSLMYQPLTVARSFAVHIQVSAEAMTIARSSAVRPHDRIAVDANILGGEPHIRGTRIPIAAILDGLAEGLTPNELCEHYPRLTCEDIQAASKYAAEMALPL